LTEGEVGLAVEHLVDHRLVARQIDLGLRGGTLFALVERVGNGRVDRLLHHLGHGRTAIDLLEVGRRHLAGAESLDRHLALELVELGVEPGHQVAGRNGHAQFALQALVQGLSNLHSVQIPL
jgi:hypothetical protein